MPRISACSWAMGCSSTRSTAARRLPPWGTSALPMGPRRSCISISWMNAGPTSPYGTDNIGGYDCGPTSMSIVVSSLTDDIVDPVEMAEWAYKNGGWCSKSGSDRSLIPNAAKAWGLPVEGCTASEPQRIVDALSDGKLVVAIMLKGHFTTGGTPLCSGVFRMGRYWWPTPPVTTAVKSCGTCPLY